jgi:hypothetical protein
MCPPTLECCGVRYFRSSVVEVGLLPNSSPSIIPPQNISPTLTFPRKYLPRGRRSSLQLLHRDSQLRCGPLVSEGMKINVNRELPDPCCCPVGSGQGNAAAWREHRPAVGSCCVWPVPESCHALPCRRCCCVSRPSPASGASACMTFAQPSASSCRDTDFDRRNHRTAFRPHFAVPQPFAAAPKWLTQSLSCASRLGSPVGSHSLPRRLLAP